MNKKGMQVEIYKMIIVLIFISVTILIFSSFFSINSKFSRERQFVTFINDINIQAKSMIGSINKIEEISFKKIENIDKIYIVNMEADLSTLEFNENELLEENIHDKAVDNVFFFENNKMVYSGVVENLNIKQPHYICIEKMLNQIDIRFVGGSKGSDLKVINEENDCSYSLLTREIVTETFGEESKDDFIKKLDFFKKLSKNIDVGIKIDYEIEYDPYEDITKVKLKLTSENPIEDLEYFLKLPKCLLEEANIDSFVHSKSEVDTEILNVDPLVMWNFGAVDNEETETTFVKVGKISDICKELISYFAYAKETGIGTGIIESERSPYVDLDKDGKINNEDVYPDDGDNDAFPDSWELFFNYDINDPNVPDKHGDDDLDGATNLEEYNFDIDPKNEDSDQDGLLDGYEIDLGINPNDDDTDDDGMKDFYEVTFGLDPNNDDNLEIEE